MCCLKYYLLHQLHHLHWVHRVRMKKQGICNVQGAFVVANNVEMYIAGKIFARIANIASVIIANHEWSHLWILMTKAC